MISERVNQSTVAAEGPARELEKATKEAGEVEYALQFNNHDVTEVHVIQQPAADKCLDQLTKNIEKVDLQKDESQLREEKPSTPVTSGRDEFNRRSQEYIKDKSVQPHTLRV